MGRVYDKLQNLYETFYLWVAPKLYFQDTKYVEIQGLLEAIRYRWSVNIDFTQKQLNQIKISIIKDLAQSEHQNPTETAFKEASMRTLYKTVGVAMMAQNSSRIHLKEAHPLPPLPPVSKEDMLFTLSKSHALHFISKQLEKDLESLQNPVSMKELAYLTCLKYREDWRQLCRDKEKPNEEPILGADTLMPILIATLMSVRTDRLRQVLQKLDTSKEFSDHIHPGIKHTINLWNAAISYLDRKLR